jgi:hypothetical protein
MDWGVGVNSKSEGTLKIRNPQVSNSDPQKIKPGVA